MLGLLLVTGCGGGEGPSSTTQREQADSAPNPAAAARHMDEWFGADAEQGAAKPKPKRHRAHHADAADAPTAHAEPEPEPEHSANPLAAKVQKEAREICSVFPQAQIAKEYGVPNNLTAVVRAYAAGYDPVLRVSAEEGCLEGLAG